MSDLDPNISLRPKVPAKQAIEDVHRVVTGLPVFIAGSAVAAHTYSQIKDDAYDDIDLFCSNPNVLMIAAEKLMAAGYQLDDRMSRVWARWMRMGFKGWHTNSLKLEHPGTWTKINLVYKLTDGHPTTSLAQVLESFDFGLLAIGLDAEEGAWRDMRSYLFPLHQPDGALPLMPNKRSNWRNGFISQYNGLRECGRYAKYYDYGFDMSLVKDDLVTGYWEAGLYLTNRTDAPDKVLLGQIYQSIASSLETDALDKIREAGSEILYLDDLDRIMEALE